MGIPWSPPKWKIVEQRSKEAVSFGWESPRARLCS